MKFHKHFWAVSLVLVSILSSCSKKDDPSTSDTLSEGTIIAKINGTKATFSGISTKSSVPGRSFLLVVGSSGTGSKTSEIRLYILTSTLNVNNYTTVASAQNDEFGAIIAFANYVPGQNITNEAYTSEHTSGNGNIDITAISDKNVQGTFKGTLRRIDVNGNATGEIVTITEGKFNMSLSD